MSQLAPFREESRVCLERPVLKIPGVEMFGHYWYASARKSLGEHSHPGAIEICYLARGRQTYLVGETPFHLKGGDVFLTFPGEEHGSGGLPQEKGELYWIILRPSPRQQRLLGLSARDSVALVDQLTQLPHRHFRGSWTLKAHLDAFLESFDQLEGPLREVTLAHHLLAYLLEVIAAGKSALAPRSGQALEPVQAYIVDHLDEALPVSRLAAQAGLSIPRFKARFKEETGVPPGEYVQRARIEAARQRLQDKPDASITRLAFDLGFSSSQYFATVFRRLTGKTPREYRELLSKS